MKKIFVVLFIVFNFISYSFATKSRLELRRELISLARPTTEESLKHRLKGEDVGEWKDIANDILFTLLRKTEVYRDKQNLHIIEDNEASLAIYPDGSIFINTGLFEYIDEKLFTSIAENVRKAKNLNLEREEFLAPFIAFEVARFALDVDLNNFISRGKNSSPFLLSSEDIFVIDEFASILLKMSGYNSNIMEEHLSRLKNDGGVASFQKIVSIDERLNRLVLSRQAIEKTSEEISNIIFQLNTQRGVGEGLQSIELLKTSYPSSLYFLRLEAIANHSMYLESLSQNSSHFIPLLPVAIIGYSYAEKYYINLENKLKVVPFLSNDQNELLKMNESLLAKSIFLYEQYNDSIEDFSMLSSYFTLLIATNDEKLKALAIEEVKSKMEKKNTSLIEKTNYAIVLLSAGQSSQKAVSLLEETLKKIDINEEKNILYEGIYFDERLVLYDYAIALSKMKKVNKQKINAIISELKSKLYVSKNDEPLVVRGLKIGDTTDKLTELWGEPSSIIYNYYFERWLYNHLKALVVVSSYSTPPMVMQIILLPYSTVSLKNDVRVNDDRKTLENTFGKSIYKAADYEVYFYEEKAIHVFYSTSGIARSIAIFQAFKQGI